MATEKNVLVIGGGLAGCFMATESAKRGHRVRMADVCDPKAASRVAAGLFNVVTGREANKTWMADEMIASLRTFTQHPDFQWLQKFIHYMPIFRPFRDGSNYNDWMVRLQEPEFGWLGNHHGKPWKPDILRNPLGGLQILPCGWAETVPLCDGILQTLEQKYDFQKVECRIDYQTIDAETGECRQDGLQGQYDEVIFAEGFQIRNNPWFQFVEIRPLKGQILELRLAPGLDEGTIILRKMFLIPKGEGRFSAGSTYELHFEDDEASEEGTQSIVAAVKEATSLPFEVVGARAAIRPTTPNRRPVLGRHPSHERLVVLNGMGTKGVLQAPFAAAMLRGWLDGELPALSSEVSVLRFLNKNV
ncbi:MAG: hypothetical protein RLZZ165_414 [Bacteroidota bacterium]|jgi:glycine/D-amino acid oxidase-like deaminating enzyme